MIVHLSLLLQMTGDYMLSECELNPTNLHDVFLWILYLKIIINIIVCTFYQSLCVFVHSDLCACRHLLQHN